MILRRLSQSLKEQNWMAICIEFVLLVVGVFLGIQVANWNAERETNRKAVEATDKLIADLRAETVPDGVQCPPLDWLAADLFHDLTQRVADM